MELLEEFKRFQKMVAKMKHLKIGKNGEMPQMTRNPQQVSDPDMHMTLTSHKVRPRAMARTCT